MGDNPIDFTRALYDSDTGKPGIPRAHVNVITPLIDGSVVYGSDVVRARALRSLKEGKLKVLDKTPIPSRQLPPLNEEGLENEAKDENQKKLFLVGDVRGNEQVGLLAMHTVFLREHNRLCDRILKVYPEASDEQVYQLARKIVGAEIQKVTYEEFLPAILGPMAPDLNSSAYDPEINVAIAAEFSGAAYRFGHSMISSKLKMVNGRGRITRLPLRKGFFRGPGYFIRAPYRVNYLIRGFVTQVAQEVDAGIVTDLRNFLFGKPGNGGLDLAALNIQRGRDLGLPPFNDVREAYNLTRLGGFDELTSDPQLKKVLKKQFKDIDKLDLWVGCLVEDHVEGASVGRLLGTIMSEQFTRLMKGDELFYLRDRDLKQKRLRGIINLEKLTMSHILQRNARVTANRKVFFVDQP